MRYIKQLMMMGFVSSAFFLQSCSKDVDVYQPVSAPEFDNQVEAEVIWSKGVGSGVGKYYSILHPAFDSKYVYAASRNGDVYAFNKITGSREWHFDIDDEDENDDRRSTRLSGGLTVDDGSSLLFVGSENGFVYAINTKDGSLAWKQEVGEEVLSSPAFDADKVFVLTSAGELIGLNEKDGKILWKTGSDSALLSLRGDSTPVPLAGKVVLYGSSNGQIIMVDQNRGLLVNQMRIGVPRGATQLSRLSDVNSSPVVISDEIYAVSFNGTMKGFLLPQMNQTWARNYNSCLDMTYDLTDLAVTDKAGHVYAVIRVDGSERWVNTSLTYRQVTAPAYFKDYVIVGDYEGWLYFLDNATGEFRSRLKLGGNGIYTGAVVDGDIAYLQTRNGEIYAVGMKGDTHEESSEDDVEDDESYDDETYDDETYDETYDDETYDDEYEDDSEE